MALVHVSIGSNQDRERSVRGAVAALRERYEDLCVSQVYETDAVGFVGDAFYNLVTRFRTADSVEQVLTHLYAVEVAQGRDRSGPKFGSRILDLDLLLYGDLSGSIAGKVLPHRDILDYPFVLGPLAELSPGSLYPVSGKSFRDLWLAISPVERKRLRAVPFDWLLDE